MRSVQHASPYKCKPPVKLSWTVKGRCAIRIVTVYAHQGPTWSLSVCSPYPPPLHAGRTLSAGTCWTPSEESEWRWPSPNHVKNRWVAIHTDTQNTHIQSSLYVWDSLGSTTSWKKIVIRLSNVFWIGNACDWLVSIWVEENVICQIEVWKKDNIDFRLIIKRIWNMLLPLRNVYKLILLLDFSNTQHCFLSKLC